MTHLELVNALLAEGSLPEAWRGAFTAVSRPVFVPEVIWRQNSEGWVSTSRADDPDRWAEPVYSDEPVVTQVDDGTTPPGLIGQRPTSSNSAPSIVAMMLDLLAVADGHRVLEIGTGSGWNAGLLAYRLGDENVISIEVDPVVADQARTALKRADRSPMVITGDGTDGYRPGAPYDRVLVTAAVRMVPYSWVEQTRPGGRIVTPWGTAYHNGILLSLAVNRDGTATGWFGGGDVAFMALRSQRDPDTEVTESGPVTESTMFADMGPMMSEFDGTFAIGLRVPNCSKVIDTDPDDEYHHHVRLEDPRTRSLATLDIDLRDAPYRVRQYGPRRLWDEVEAAHAWWVERGRPERTRFGLTVTPAEQWVWLDSPEIRVSRVDRANGQT